MGGQAWQHAARPPVPPGAWTRTRLPPRGPAPAPCAPAGARRRDRLPQRGRPPPLVAVTVKLPSAPQPLQPTVTQAELPPAPRARTA